jgi:hypothetical protein
LGNEAKWEYFRVMYERYHQAEPKTRPALLDEFCVTTGYNRKYAIRLLKPRRGMSSRQGCESSEVKVLVPPIACSQADSISDACEGNDARSART